MSVSTTVATMPSPGPLGDPVVWMIAGVVIAILMIIMIYYSILTGDKKP